MKKLFALLAVIALIAPLAFAQDAAIRGTVVLEDGSAIPGVAVSLEGERIAKKTTVTTTEGNFRFINLFPGTYKITAILEGFKTYEQTGIELATGQNITLEITMVTGQLEETMQITGTANVIDTRSTTVQKTLSEKMIQSLPTARNTWTLLNLIPGMMVDRPDVGGAESGQQSSFYGNGVSDTDSQWNLDGADVTDMSALGAAPAYYDTNALEELQVTVGSNDITARTGGTQINMVTRSGGNDYSGSMHLYVEDDELEFNPNPPDDFDDTNYTPPGINSLYQYGINFGGPIVKDKLFFFGSYSIQDISKRTEAGLADDTFLKSGYFKLDAQLGNTTIYGKINLDDKVKNGRTRFGPASHEADSLWDQSGPGWAYSGGLQHIIGNLMVNAKVSYVNGGFVLNPRGSDLNADGYEVGKDMYIQFSPSLFQYGSQYLYGCDRNQLNASLDANYFLEGVLGGDHELRFGVDYLDAFTSTYYQSPNGHWIYEYAPWTVYYDASGAYDATGSQTPYNLLSFETPEAEPYNMNRFSVYLQDTATFGKLTVNLGLRYDNEWGSMQEATFPAHYDYDYLPASWQQYLGPAEQKGVDGATWENISPRASFTYDITGDGRNVLKFSAARYASAGGNTLSTIFSVASTRYISTLWHDVNGNRTVDWGTDTILTPDWNTYLNLLNNNDLWNYFVWGPGGFDPNNFGEAPNQLDPDFSAPLTDELSLTFEKAIGEDIAVSLTGFYKRKHNLIRYPYVWSDGTIESNADWELGGTSPELGVDVYKRSRGDNIGLYYTNFDKRYQQYIALQGIFTKRLSHGWMLNGSFTLNSWTDHWDEDEILGTYLGGTNYSQQIWSQYDYWNGSAVAPEAGGSGLEGVFANARWMFKLSGLVQLPLDFNFTWTFEAREGYMIDFYDEKFQNVELRDTSISDTRGSGEDHMPAYYMLNIGLEKDFKITDKVTGTFFCDVYNALNHQAITCQNKEPGNHDEILTIVPPGLLQFGFRVNF